MALVVKLVRLSALDLSRSTRRQEALFLEVNQNSGCCRNFAPNLSRVTLIARKKRRSMLESSTKGKPCGKGRISLGFDNYFLSNLKTA